jgi:AAA15 family ATPase/GTPase
MIPGKGTLKQNHKTSSIKGISCLKTGVVFGANASGKSNLIKAIDFGRNLLLKGNANDTPIKFQPYRLDLNKINSNTRLEYEIQNEGKNYAYGFVFNSKIIVEEWLYEITNTSEKLIFERNTKDKNHFNIEPLFKKNKEQEQQQFLTFIAKGTPNNQLFLTEIKNRRVKDNVTDINDLLNVIDWFQNTLKVIFPEDKYKEGIKYEIKDDEKLQYIFEELLNYFDTGISGIKLEPVDFESIDIPSEIIKNIKSDLLNTNSENVRALLSIKKLTYFISKSNDGLKIHKLMTKHNVFGQLNPELFDTSDESDGTNRIIDFIPLIIDLLEGNNVFIIDEMERSLHANLIYEIIDLFIDKSTNVNSQLILTSHETNILTQKLLRKDEIWFVEKDINGSSSLYSLEEYNIRFDKEIRKDYLIGRFKAIANFGNRNSLTILPNQI